MSGVALNGASTTEVTVSGHINIRRYVVTGYDPFGNPYYGWSYSTTSARVSGECNATPSNVFINSSNPIRNGDTVSETDNYTVPSGYEYYSGAHTNAQGSVTSGNANNVFIGGVSVATIGSRTRTHTNTNTTIANGGSNNVFIGEG